MRYKCVKQKESHDGIYNVSFYYLTITRTKEGNLFQYEKQISFEFLPDRYFDWAMGSGRITWTVKNSDESGNLFQHEKQISSKFFPFRLLDLGYMVRSITRRVKNSDERGNLFKHEKQISFEFLPVGI